jgi:pilus assembly protein FimV
LLLSFFYNFEKIISSQTITGEEITTLLKGDVRKFRILQYQINQSEGDLSPQEAATTTDRAPATSGTGFRGNG